MTTMFWEIGRYLNSVVLGDKRAEYGKRILTELATKLTAEHGKSFAEQNLYRMMLFAERFSDMEILSKLATKLSWSHFIELLRLKTHEARMYYANDAITRNYGVIELRRQISRKTYERQKTTNMATDESAYVVPLPLIPLIDLSLPDRDDSRAFSLQTDETSMFTHIARMIETRKCRAGAFANHEVIMMFWEIGQYINSVMLGNKHAEYGKRIVAELATKLVRSYGRSFSYDNLRRMMRFSEKFNNLKILSPLTTKLTWSHFIELLPMKSENAWLYYANETAERNLSAKELRRQISRKAYERREIANARLTEGSAVPLSVFKDPYILDVLDLNEYYHEADLEKAILKELESFILEFGNGFTFIERQKRMIIGDEDVVLDLLFFHRKLKRLVAVELKVGKFKAEYMGQMLLYLKWLDKYERRDGEEPPIGMILCTSANREKIELLEMDKAGIGVAEYWTDLPPKAELERKIREIMNEAKERLEHRRSSTNTDDRKSIDLFFESKDDNDEDD
jgi:predicted nuclease of restriction endonuclease-like (RecB) superfamily